jgi:hypothetical protein
MFGCIDKGPHATAKRFAQRIVCYAIATWYWLFIAHVIVMVCMYAYCPTHMFGCATIMAVCICWCWLLYACLLHQQSATFCLLQLLVRRSFDDTQSAACVAVFWLCHPLCLSCSAAAARQKACFVHLCNSCAAVAFVTVKCNGLMCLTLPHLSMCMFPTH